MKSEQASELRHAQIISRLSEAVAHDINNLLSGVLGYSELLLEENVSEDHKPLIREIMNLGKRIADLAGLLLVFRKSEFKPEILDPNQSISNIQKYIALIGGSKTALGLSLQSGLWPIRSDPAHFSQLLFAIAAEMRDTICDSGHFTVETKNVSIPDGSATGIPLEPGRYVCITATTSAQAFRPHPESADERLRQDLEVSRIAEICGGRTIDYGRSGHGFTIRIYFPAAES